MKMVKIIIVVVIDIVDIFNKTIFSIFITLFPYIKFSSVLAIFFFSKFKTRSFLIQILKPLLLQKKKKVLKLSKGRMKEICFRIFKKLKKKP